MPVVIRNVRLSSAQQKAIEEQIAALKRDGKVDNPYAVATKSFTDKHTIKDGRWVLKRK
jgi:hypothetical protein